MFVYSSDRPCVDYEAITVSTTAIGVTETMKKNGASPCVGAFITCEAANVRFRLDGTAPTTTEGHQLLSGQNLNLTNESDICNFLAIRDDAVDATLRVSYRY